MPTDLFNNRRPLYQVLAEQLLSGIESGEYPVGDLLPSESQLCSIHNVSRHTVRAAIRELADRGVLFAQPGVGTRVISKRIEKYTQTLKALTDLTGYVTETTRKVLKRGRTTARDAGIELPGAPDGEWDMFEAVRQVTDSDQVIAWTQVFVLPQYARSLDDVTEHGLVYDKIEEHFGVTATALRQVIKAVACPDEAAKCLGFESGAPALSVVREYIAEPDGVFEVSWSIHPPERFENKMELTLSRNG